MAPPLSQKAVDSIIQQVYELAEVIVSANYFLVDATFQVQDGEWTLALFLDHPNEEVRVTVEDCRDISEALNPMIDENIKELLDFPYVLEVSSPGLFRELHRPREFNFYANRRVEVSNKNEKKQKNYFATILGFDAASNSVKLQRHPLETSDIELLPWPDDAINISLSPDLTQEIEIKTVPRTIQRGD